MGSPLVYKPVHPEGKSLSFSAKVSSSLMSPHDTVDLRLKKYAVTMRVSVHLPVY